VSLHTKTLVYKSPDSKVVGLIRELGGSQAEIVKVLRTLQTEYGHLTPHLIDEVARELQIPVSRVHGIATFYSMLTTTAPLEKTIRICDGPYCMMRGAGDLLCQMQAQLGASWTITRTSCLGLCDRAPAALVRDSQVGPIQLEHMDRYEIGWCGEVSDYRQPRPREVRAILPDPAAANDTLETAFAKGTFPALQKALRLSPEKILGEMEASKLRGRGGAGFPAGRKWRFVASQPRKPKYVVCNADESEPLSFKDRVILELCPQLVLEGMAIIAHAVGAEAGYIYIRGEYRTQVERLLGAIADAEEHGWLGSNIGGTAFSFPVHVHLGAGAYICGEETALLESLEGRRGEPRVRPPFPPVQGYRGQPTVVSNVETLASVPKILARGADWYCSLGNPKNPGTKLYTLLGEVNRPGLFEAPLGLTLREVIDTYGEGMRTGSSFHFALTGGAAGTIVPPSLLDVPMDYDSGSQGVALGSGAMLICDQTVSPLRIVRELVRFFELESCGKCTPCRIGTYESRKILDQMLAGHASSNQRERLAALSSLLHEASLCGLGNSVSNPVQSALKHFPEYFAGNSGAKNRGVDR
jgi:NADH:ubiquinone oxidoreductase subunit F (NADH-binding)/NADH:ubiquinone oxidoreductase subunit E